jgi:LuxR family maltose regulon positive regulatory protein
VEALKLSWLGIPQVELRGKPVKLETRKAAAMLAYLSLRAGDSPRELLATMFWPEGSQQKALANLRRTLSSLNASLPGWIDADRETICLKRNVKLWVDIDAFHQSLSQLQEHGHSTKETCDTCLPVLSKASELYRGDFLEGLNLTDCPNFDEWQFFQRDGLRQEFADVLQRLAYGYAQRSRWDQAIPCARRWLALDRLHEPAQRALMDLYARSGQRAAVLRQYEELRRLLNEQTGQEPELETRRLYEQIRGPEEAQRIKPSAQTSLSFPLLKTKLYIPAVPASRVIRSHLVDRMGEIEQRELTLISAPAGFGKTTLLAEWITQTSLPVAWLSLDSGENDPYRFLSYLIAALESVQEGVGTEAQQIMRSPQRVPPHIILASLINDLGKALEGYILVLDDYQFISEHAVHETTAYLLDHVPAKMHIVISTRADPPLQLGRLRAHGQMLELRTKDLRFNPDEATEFLNGVMRLGLSAQDIHSLEERTEGWVAGLKMAAFSIQGRSQVSEFIQAFSGSHRYILDYLVEEVLKQQPPYIQTFLLQTSILEKLSAPLCDELLGDEWRELIQTNASPTLASGQSVLEYLEQSNLFIVSLDDERQWYRYHHLFADLLSSQLKQKLPELLPVLHARAASWYEANSMLAQAVNHALAAHDHERAALLVETLASALWEHGNYAMVFSWIETLPEKLVFRRPWLSMYRAWELAVDGKPREAEAMVDIVEEALSSKAGDIDARNLAGCLGYVRAVLADIRGDTEAMIAFDRAALENLDAKNYAMRRGITYQLGRAYHLAGDQKAAQQIWDDVVGTDQRIGTGFASIISLCMLTWLKVAVGRLQDARRDCQDASRWIDEVHEPHTSRTAGLVWLVNANVALEAGDLTATQRHILVAIQCFEKWGTYYALVMGYVILASAQRRERDYLNAWVSLQKAEEVIRTREIYADALYWLRAEKVNLWLERNEVAAAAGYLEDNRINCSDPVNFVNELQYVALARVLIAQGKSKEAVQLLIRLEASAEKGDRHGRLIRILNTHAVALAMQGKASKAAKILEKSLRLAGPEGFHGVFLDEREPMIRLLKRLKSSNSNPQLKDYADRLLQALTRGKVAA